MSIGKPPPDRTVRTASGRTIGYYEYGDPWGMPAFAFHGTPASGASFVFLDAAARARGLRVIAPDRPGIGKSDRKANGRGTAYDGRSDVAETADALDVDDFVALGYSGGAPFALAAAHAFPDRVTAVAIVSGAGQVGQWARISDFEPTDARVTFLSDRVPVVASTLLTLSAWSSRFAPGASERFVRWQLPRADRDAMRQYESPRAAVAAFTNAFAHGAAGVVADYAAGAREWGFDVSEITVPVRCWHGTNDRTVPFRHSEELVARVPGADLVAWPGLAHLALMDRADEVVAWLAARAIAREDEDGAIGRSDQSAP